MFRMLCIACVVAALVGCGSDEYRPPSDNTSPEEHIRGISGYWYGNYTITVDGMGTTTRQALTIIERDWDTTTATVNGLCPRGEGKVSFRYTGQKELSWGRIMCRSPFSPETEGTPEEDMDTLLVIDSGTATFSTKPEEDPAGQIASMTMTGRYVKTGDVVRNVSITYIASRGY